MEHFAGLTFPYSREIRDLPRLCVPNLHIENTHQSLYSVLKSVRSDVVGKKLRNSGYLLFDRFVMDVLGASALKVYSQFPPENEEKLEKFLTQLSANDVPQVGIDAVIYYLLKDFSFEAAEKFACGGNDINHVDHSTIMLRIPKPLYDLTNAIYFIDRFDIFRSLGYLNANDYSSLPQGFLAYFIKLSNIVPYHDEFEISSAVDVESMKSYIDSQSCKPSACSVISTIRALKVPIMNMDADTQLLFIESLTDLNPLSAIRFIEESEGNYEAEPTIPHQMLLRITVTKILLKTHKQQNALRLLDQANKISGSQYDQLFRHLAMFSLVDTKIENKITDMLYDILYSIPDENDKTIRAKFPNYFTKLDEEKTHIRRVARDILAWKCAQQNFAHRLAEIASVNIGADHVNTSTSLKEIAAHFC